MILFKRISHFLLFLIMILAISECGPGESIREEKSHQEKLGDRETANRRRDSHEAGPDKEKSMEWEPEFFVIPESRLGIMADESCRFPPDLTPAEDLWIVVQPQRSSQSSSKKDMGVSIHDTRGNTFPIDLLQTTIDSRILGCVSEVSLNHRFIHHSKAQADMIFSIILPDNAGLSDFILTIGERKIRGIVRERENAEKIFKLARERGLVASLIEDAGENQVEGRIQSVPPEIEIESMFRYVSTVPFYDGFYHFSCPITVTHSDPGSVKPSDAEISVTMEAGMPIRSINSPTHSIEITRPTAHSAKIQAQSVESPSPTEFILDYDITGETAETALFIDRSSHPGHAILLMVPPQEYDGIRRLSVDISILIDCSRSMRGKKLFTAKKIAEYLLENLDDNDSFHVITFSGKSLTELQAGTVGSNRNIRDTISKIHAAPSTDGEGMLPGFRKSLTSPHDSSRYRLLVILTDGYVDDHGDIRRFMNSNIGSTRIFPLIVGATSNTILFENMARFGRGGILYVNPDDDLPNTAEYFIETLRRPVLRDITVDWNTLGGRRSYPVRIPDLHIGRPIVLAACVTADRDTPLTISGTAHTGEEAVEIVTTGHSSRAPALGFIWARKHLADLTHRSVLSTAPEMTGEIAEIAMQYGILTPYTSFALVDTRSGRE